MNKYLNKRTPCRQGHNHRSIFEAEHCNGLFYRMQNGEFPEYFSEYDFDLWAWSGIMSGYKKTIGKIVVDFWIPKLLEVHETKGFETADWKIKRKIFQANHPEINYRTIKQG